MTENLPERSVLEISAPQIIGSTHSHFVLTSAVKTAVYSLDTHEVITGLEFMGFEEVVERVFN